MGKYRLEKIAPTIRHYEVLMEGDCGDADYVTTIKKYSQDKFNDVVNDLIDIKYNYMGRGKLSNYEYNDWLDIPCGDHGYCHTLITMRITMYDTDGCVYNVILEN